MTEYVSAATPIAIFGGGRMGEALVSGLLRGGSAPADIVVSEKDGDRSDYLTRTYGVAVLANAEAAGRARTVIIATKPHDVDKVLAELGALIGSSQIVMSVAAGVTIAHIEAALGEGVPVVRCMPNTPALVEQGMTAIAGGTHASAEHLALAEALLSTVGRVARVPERYLDAVTALSGSGPAYFFLLAEAMIEAGVLLGLPRALAAELTVQTAVGAATMLRDSGEHPVQLREAVSSPAGTTVAAVRELESRGLRAAVLAAAEAAAVRSAELGG